MSEFFPEAPPLEQGVIERIAEHAERAVAWLEREQAQAASHGHPADSLSKHINGWRFVAVAMREWNG